MNIKELIKQAGGIQYDEDGEELTPLLVGREINKFAELLVKECTDLVQKYMSRWPEDHELTKQIKAHFGVK